MRLQLYPTSTPTPCLLLGHKVVPISDQYELLSYVEPQFLLREFGGLSDFEFRPESGIPGINWWDLESHQAKQLAAKQVRTGLYTRNR